ncbi:hypothetical protein [Microbacterium sp. bgisy189]
MRTETAAETAATAANPAAVTVNAPRNAVFRAAPPGTARLGAIIVRSL